MNNQQRYQTGFASSVGKMAKMTACPDVTHGQFLWLRNRESLHLISISYLMKPCKKFLFSSNGYCVFFCLKDNTAIFIADTWVKRLGTTAFEGKD